MVTHNHAPSQCTCIHITHEFTRTDMLWHEAKGSFEASSVANGTQKTCFYIYFNHAAQKQSYIPGVHERTQCF